MTSIFSKFYRYSKKMTTFISSEIIIHILQYWVQYWVQCWYHKFIDFRYYHDGYYWWLYRLNSSQLLQFYFKNGFFATNFGCKVTRVGILNWCGYISTVLSIRIIISEDIISNYDKILKKNGRLFRNPHQKVA